MSQPVEETLIYRYPQNYFLIFPLMLYSRGQRALSMALFVLLVVFFRNPSRRPKVIQPNAIYAPAEGKIVSIGEHDVDKTKKKISIYLTLFDVHVQYIPVAGKVISKRYKAGKFNPAYILAKSEYNERMETDILATGGQTLTVVQIAGQLVRRIESFVERGQEVKVGNRLGMIKFGSRVDIYLPMSSVILVKEGQHVRAGVDVIGYL